VGKVTGRERVRRRAHHQLAAQSKWWARRKRERNDALKKAGQLQSAADMFGCLKSKELRPPK
jgi:hypothetical protein